jgi:hypothetical protein
MKKPSIQDLTPMRFVIRAAVVGLFATGAALGLRAQEQLDFVLSFIDAKGAAVTDVTAGELSIVENGIMGTIVSIQPDTHPLDVQLLVDNGAGMGTALAEIRTGIKGFFSALPNDAQVSLVTLAPQPRFLLRAVTGPQNGVQAADRLAPDVSVAAFLDALVEASERLRNQAKNHVPVIVAVASTSPDGSSSREQHFKTMAQRVSELGAIVHAVVLTSGARLSSPRVPGGVASDSQYVIGSEIARLTGGRYEQIAVSSRLATLLPEIGALVSAQSHRFLVRARRPAGAKGSPGAVGFGIARPGVTVRATFAR